MPNGSRHLVDPELAAALDTYPPLSQPIGSLQEVRDQLAQSLQNMPVRHDLPVQREEVRLPGPAGAPAVRALLYRPTRGAQPRPAILHIHGGGFVVGAPEFADTLNRELAAELDCVVCSVAYRLAPDHPHPAQVEDCFAALQALHGGAKEWGLDPLRIGVKGESAGGGLAACLALLARDREGPPLAFQHLIHPMLDDRTCVHPDPHPYAGEFVWNAERNRYGWSSLLGHDPGMEGVSPYAAAARAADLTGLPPTFMTVGALDLFLEEDMDYARRLTRAGVPVELHVYPGAFHGSGAASEARISKAAVRDSREALRRALQG